MKQIKTHFRSSEFGCTMYIVNPRTTEYEEIHEHYFSSPYQAILKDDYLRSEYASELYVTRAYLNSIDDTYARQLLQRYNSIIPDGSEKPSDVATTYGLPLSLDKLKKAIKYWMI